MNDMEAEMDADAENYTNELRGECDWMEDLNNGAT
jgi:hypothetical protein